MIEFEKTVNQAEYNAKFLNLTDDRGNTYGRKFNLDHLTRIAIVGNSGQVTFAKKQKNNQIWGTLSHWYKSENIVPGSRILVRFDPTERLEGFPVIRLITEVVGTTALPQSGEPKELELIKNHGVELIPFAQVIKYLCSADIQHVSGAAGTDIAEIIRFYADDVSTTSR